MTRQAKRHAVRLEPAHPQPLHPLQVLEKLLVAQIRALQKYARRERSANPAFGFVPKFRILTVGEPSHSRRMIRSKKGRPSSDRDAKRIYADRRLTKRDAILALFVRDDRPVTIEELQRVYKAAGGKRTSLGPLLSRMQIQGVVRRGRRKGLWVRGRVLWRRAGRSPKN